MLNCVYYIGSSTMIGRKETRLDEKIRANHMWQQVAKAVNNRPT